MEGEVAEGVATPSRATRPIAEFFLIVISILAAFGVEEFRETINERELRSVALANIRVEIEHNIAAVEDVLPYHREVAGEIASLLADRSRWEGQRGFEVGAQVLPQGILPPQLSRTAWETAQVTGAVALFDYELSQRVASAYAGQDEGVEATVDRMIGHVFSLETFRSEDTEAVLMLLAGLAGELAAQEAQLKETLVELLNAGW